MAIDWQPFLKLVNESQSFVLTSHMRPDCDAIGSERGLALALRRWEKMCESSTAIPCRRTLRLSIRKKTSRCSARTFHRMHLLATCSQWSTPALGDSWGRWPMSCAAQRRKIAIDHHVSEDDLGATFFKDSTSESTGRLVLQAIDALGVALTQAMAVPLFAAISTDTGWFRFASVTEATLTAAARLVGAVRNRTQYFRRCMRKTPSADCGCRPASCRM